MKIAAPILLVAIAGLAPAGARADLYKCVAKDGKVTYQAEPCAQSDASKRLQAPSGPPSGTAAGKPERVNGWSPQLLESMRSGCVRDGFAGGKRGWQASGDPRPFPEARAMQAVQDHCACLMRRVTAMDYATFAADPVGNLTRFSNDATNGGECHIDASTLQ